MKRKSIKIKFILTTSIVLLSLSLIPGLLQNFIGTALADTHTSVASGNWNTNGTWDKNAVPAAGDDVIIASGHTVTMDGNEGYCTNLTINGTANWGQARTTNASGNLTLSGTISGSATGVLKVTGNLSVPSGATAAIQRNTLTITGTSSIDGTVNFNTSTAGTKTFVGLVTINEGGIWDNSINEAVTICGGIANAGTFTGGSGTYTFDTTSTQALGGSQTLTFAGIISVSAGITLTNSGTVTMTGTGAGRLAGAGTFVNDASATLNYAGSTITVTTFTATASGNTVNYNSATTAQTILGTTYVNLTISKSGQTGTLGAATIVNGTLTVTAGTLNLSTRNLTTNGSTSISGTLNDSSSTGTNIFVGLITVQTGGSWTSTGNSAYTIRGGLTHNGTTFTAGTGIYTFNTNPQSISGSSAISIPRVTVTGITLTNNGTLTVTTALAGTGTLTQGTNATLNINFTGAVGIANLGTSASGNTVTYGFAGAQTIKLPVSSTYWHLTLSGSGVKTMSATAMTVSGNFTTSGTVSTTALAALTIGGDVTIGSGTTFTAGAFTHSVGGNWSNSGTFTPGTGTVNFTATSGTRTLSGSTNFNNLTFGGSATYNVTAGSTLIINANATVTVNVTATLNFSGTSGNLVTLLRSGASGQWNLNVIGGYSANYVSVRDSNATGKKIVAYNSTNVGNNTNWVFPDKLAFIPAEGQTVTQDKTSLSIAIEIQYVGTAVTVPGNANIILTSTSSGGRFSTDGATWSDSNTLTVTITAGTSSVSFYYKDSVVGTPTITASEDPSLGLEDTTQIETIKSKINTFLVSASSPQVAGSSFTLTITALDDLGAIATSYSDPVNIAVDYVSPATGSGTLAVTSTSSFVMGVATITNQSFSDCGTITITVTKIDDATKKGTSSNIVFIPYDFVVSTDATTQTVNRAFNLVVTARNAQGATCPNYKGTANLSIVYVSPSSDQAGSISPSSLGSTNFTNGIAQLTTTKYNKWGTIKIKATDSLSSNRYGQSQDIRFNPKDFLITLSEPPKSRSFYYKDEQFTATVTVRDQDNNMITNYQGSIELSSSDRTLSSRYTFLPADSGTHKFQVSFSIPGKITLSAKDATYTIVTGQSAEFEVKEAKIKVFSTAGPVGNVAVTVQILDSQDKVISDDDSTTFTVTLQESTANNTATSDATTTAVTFKGGAATIYVKDQEAETVTITPVATPSLTAVAGTVTFGSFRGRGIGIDMWREIK